jgi:ABC-type Na+ efflux pump permease subunit
LSGYAVSDRGGFQGEEMNKKPINILVLAAIAFVFCILINISPLISVFFSNAASATVIIDNCPMLAELVIMAIIFGIMFIMFKTPNKKE